MITGECSWSPSGCSMASDTIRAELAKVFNRFGMAGNTGRLCADKGIVEVAIFAIDGNVRSREREIAQVVIKGYAFPIVWRMTCFTLGSELSLMFILLKMTGIAILRSRL